MSITQKRKRNRHIFLLTFFEDYQKEKYAEKIVNGWYLVKYKNENNGLWEVAIYTPDAFRKYKFSFKKDLKQDTLI